jgi:hypothetical protein
MVAELSRSKVEKLSEITEICFCGLDVDFGGQKAPTNNPQCQYLNTPKKVPEKAVAKSGKMLVLRIRIILVHVLFCILAYNISNG